MSYPYDPHLRSVDRSLSGGQRIMRGFRRFGLALALPVFLIGMVVTLWTGWTSTYLPFATATQVACIVHKMRTDGVVAHGVTFGGRETATTWRAEYQNRQVRFQADNQLAANDIARVLHLYIIDYGQSGCPGPNASTFVTEIPVTPPDVPSFLGPLFAHVALGSAITVALSALLFAAPVLVGWILAGFTRD